MTPAQQNQLLDLARQTIGRVLKGRAPPPPLERVTDPALHEPGASFVTLYLENALRGCVGSLEALQPLARDVAANALAAAFRDPRFDPLEQTDFARTRIHLSVLDEPEPVAFRDEEELLGKLRPLRDGLVLTAGERRATFLPAVWEQLPDPREFLERLRHKAGLPEDFPLTRARIERYEVRSFSEEG